MITWEATTRALGFYVSENAIERFAVTCLDDDTTFSMDEHRLDYSAKHYKVYANKMIDNMRTHKRTTHGTR